MNKINITEEIGCIEIANKNDWDLSELDTTDSFTTNKNYLGKIKNIPIYINKRLSLGEINMINKNTTIVELADGKYEGKVSQVYEKLDNDKYKICIELDLENSAKEKITHVLTFCLEGFKSEKQMEIAKSNLDYICKSFGVSNILSIAGSNCILFVETRETGHKNYKLYQRQELIDLDEGQYKAKLVKVYRKNKDGVSKINCALKIKPIPNGKEYPVYVTFNESIDYDIKAIEYFLDNSGLTEEDFNKELDIDCFIVVSTSTSKNYPGKIFKNKKIKFPKK